MVKLRLDLYELSVPIIICFCYMPIQILEGIWNSFVQMFVTLRSCAEYGLNPVSSRSRSLSVDFQGLIAEFHVYSIFSNAKKDCKITWWRYVQNVWFWQSKSSHNFMWFGMGGRHLLFLKTNFFLTFILCHIQHTFSVYVLCFVLLTHQLTAVLWCSASQCIISSCITSFLSASCVLNAISFPVSTHV